MLTSIEALVNSALTPCYGINFFAIACLHVRPSFMQWHYNLDGQACGPVNESELAQLLAQKKINADTLVWCKEMTEWQPLAKTDLIEKLLPADVSGSPANTKENDPTTTLAAESPSFESTDIPSLNDPEVPELVGNWTGGASWFFWIAGLTVLNVVLIIANSPVIMALGLAVAEYLVYDFGYAYDAASDTYNLTTNGMLIGAGISAVFCALMVGIGWMARRGNSILYIIGMVLFAADTLIFLLPGMFSIIGFGFHCYALYQLFNGLMALLKLQKLGVFNAAPDTARA